MATVAKLNLSSLECHQFYHRRPPPLGGCFRRSVGVLYPFGVKGCGRIRLKPCRAFRSEEGGSEEGELDKKYWWESQKGLDNLVRGFRSAVWSCSKPSLRSDHKFRESLEKLEENLFLVCNKLCCLIILFLFISFSLYIVVL